MQLGDTPRNFMVDLSRQDSVSPPKESTLNISKRLLPFRDGNHATTFRYVVVDDEPNATTYQVFLDLSHHRQKR